MTPQDYSATLLIAQGKRTTFDSIKNFRGWWSEQIEGETNKLNEVFFYHYKDIHLCKIKLIELVANNKLVYQVVDNRFNFTKDKREWINTKLIFEISTEGNKTKVEFTHEGLVPEYECYEICNNSWDGYIKNSLYNLITTGKGQPNPKESEEFDTDMVKEWKLK
ncbi:MAG: SRPBCC domain-containing protein [Flavobacterium sp.]|nr:SRPBCC domain-containing protein [Pedobacter sp.]